MKLILLFWVTFRFLSLSAQSYDSDWDAYVLEWNGKPVSVVVDLGLADVAPMKSRSQVIIVRTQLLRPGSNGQPDRAEADRLDSLENELVGQLANSNGALYAGRYTQRGLRAYYFYTLDTVGYEAILQQVFSRYTTYTWLGRAMEDKEWSHYRTVLYPPPTSLERILNRRLVDKLQHSGDALLAPRRIDHFFYFKTKSQRDQFLRTAGMEAFHIEAMPEADEKQPLPYGLQLYKNDIPDYALIENLILPLWEKAQKYQGKYEGWETYLVR